VRLRIVFRRVGEAGFTAQTHYRARRSARHSFDPCARSSTFASLRLRAFAFLSSNSRDLCARSTTFAPLRSFLPTSRIGVRSLPFVGGVQLPAVAGAQGLKYRRFDA
jgi:hypothetical protein